MVLVQVAAMTILNLYYLHIHSVIFHHIALSIQTCHMLMAEPSTYDMFALFEKERLCWRLSRQHMTCFCFKIFLFQDMKIWTSHMLMAQPSTYNKFERCHGSAINISILFYKNTNMSYVDGSAINIWHVWIDRAIL